MKKLLQLWNDEKKRAIIYQILLLFLIFYTIYFLISNTLINMEKRHISSGFDFLTSKTGFGIIQNYIDYDESSTYLRAYFVSLINTVVISFFGVIFATMLGFFIGVSRLSKNFLLNKCALVYVEIFRNVPLLLQIFFWYHAVLKPLSNPRDVYSQGDVVSFGINNRGIYFPDPVYGDGMVLVLIAFILGIIFTFFYKNYARKLQIATGKQLPVLGVSLVVLILLPAITYGIVELFSSSRQLDFEYAVMQKFQLEGGFKIIPEFMALFLSLSIYTASFIAEIVRSGIQSVSHGQTEAARSLGVRDRLTLKLIIIPQAMRVIIPPMTSQYLNLIKNSSLAAAIAYPDIVSVFAGTVLNQTGQAIEIIAITMLTYLTFSLLTSAFMNWYNKRTMIQER